ncbi:MULTISPECIES: ABC transporter substrate-binding protein [unclassified Ensifer]|uniref:ABC transporter substrate-binding protein n=1 Tax=unclassified Ensifer TaxID=2633371 RepID=UPI000AF425A3|nr:MULTISPECIES: ABC transporter substrate-binding protein [unclassified Ensifer]
MKTVFEAGVSRRRLLQVSGAGVVTIAALGSGILPARAKPYDGKFTWISPRGTIEVMDDYAIWVAKAMGYYDDLGVEVELQPGPPGGTAVVQFTSVGQADMGFPAPGILGNSIEANMGLVSVFGTGARDLFNIAFRKGEGMQDLKGLEGKTVLLGSAAWQSIADPMLAAVGVDTSKVTYLEAGFPNWTNALASGQGDACLAWEGLRATLDAKKLEFDYWMGMLGSPLPSNSQVVRRSDVDDPDRNAFLKKFLKGLAMGHAFAEYNPRAATDIIFKALPATREALGPRYGTESLMQIHRTFKGPMTETNGWGHHDIRAFDLFFKIQKKLGLLSVDIDAQDYVLNDFIPEANEFDHQKVKAAAEAYDLPEDLAAVDMADVEAHFYDRAINQLN